MTTTSGSTRSQSPIHAPKELAHKHQSGHRVDYGLEVVLSTDVDYGSPWASACVEEGNKSSLEDAVDQLEETQDVALL